MKRETKNKTRDDTDDGESYSSYSSGEEDIRSSKPSVEQAFTQVLRPHPSRTFIRASLQSNRPSLKSSPS